MRRTGQITDELVRKVANDRSVPVLVEGKIVFNWRTLKGEPIKVNVGAIMTDVKGPVAAIAAPPAPAAAQPAKPQPAAPVSPTATPPVPGKAIVPANPPTAPLPNALPKAP